MDGSNQKVSFIPKGPLAREESFLERKRPRSVIGFLATFVFVASMGSYAGLYFYDGTLNGQIVSKTEDIRNVQKLFIQSSDVAEAKVFRSRAELAKELLFSHNLVSPVFSFLAENTLEDILYNKFSFVKGANGMNVTLTGEAPTYAALAYQVDTFRKRTKELSSFAITNITLTKLGGISFEMNMVFTPRYLSYGTDRSKENQASVAEAKVSAPQPEIPKTNLTPLPSNPRVSVFPSAPSATPASSSSSMLTPQPPAVSPSGGATSSGSVLPTRGTATTSSAVAEQKSWWSWFVFW